MPRLARVIGTVWAPEKYADLEGAKIQIVRPLTAEGEPDGRPFLAVDAIGAGAGELVFYVTAYEAVMAYGKDLVPIDAALIGIVDRVDFVEPAPGELLT
ncbi:MAG: EutN/CcmL family microcompartment protein [Planctomycetes bacterium]|nr:EutN/CcmL family microcompartment protein [Planctomycetota bacterium]